MKLFIFICIFIITSVRLNAQEFDFNLNYIADPSFENQATFKDIYENRANYKLAYLRSLTPTTSLWYLRTHYTDYSYTYDNISFPIKNLTYPNIPGMYNFTAKTGFGFLDMQSGYSISKIKKDLKKSLKNFTFKEIKESQAFGNKLVKPLQKDKYYYVYEHVYQYAGSSNILTNFNSMRFYSDSFCKITYYSNEFFTTPTTAILAEEYRLECLKNAFGPSKDTTEVMFKNYVFPKDTCKWEKVGYIYKASGTEKVLALGNFVPESKKKIRNPTYFIKTNPYFPFFNPFFPKDSTKDYYFLYNNPVDDIGVVELGDIKSPIKLVKTELDTFCNKFKTTLHAELNPLIGNFLWSTNDTLATIQVKEAGLYNLNYSLDDTTLQFKFNVLNPFENYNNKVIPSLNIEYVNSNNQIKINIPYISENNVLIINDNSGKIIYNKKINSTVIATDYFKPGMYFYMYTDGCITHKGKFIVLSN